MGGMRFRRIMAPLQQAMLPMIPIHPIIPIPASAPRPRPARKETDDEKGVGNEDAGGSM